MPDTPSIPSLVVPVPLGATLANTGVPDLPLPEGEGAVFERLADLPAPEPDPSAELTAVPMAVPVLLAGFLLPRLDLAPEAAASAMPAPPGILPAEGSPEGRPAADMPLAAGEAAEPVPIPSAPAPAGVLQLDGAGWAGNTATPSLPLAPTADKPLPQRAEADPAATTTPSGDRSALTAAEPPAAGLPSAPSAAPAAAAGMTAASAVPEPTVRTGPSGVDPSGDVPPTTSDSNRGHVAATQVERPAGAPTAATAFAQIVARMQDAPPTPGAHGMAGVAMPSRPNRTEDAEAPSAPGDPGQKVSSSPTLAKETAPGIVLSSPPETDAPAARTAVLPPIPAAAAAFPGSDTDRGQGLVQVLDSEAMTGTARATPGAERAEAPGADRPSEDRQILAPSGAVVAEKAAGAEGLAGAVPALPTSSHPVAHPERAGSVMPAPLPDAVPAQIVRAASDSPAPVTEIRLSPEELGAVRIELRTEGERAIVIVTAERGDTLDLLRRHADRLASEFRSAGYSQLDLGFGQWAGTDRGPGTGSPQPEALPTLETASAGETVAYAAPARAPAQASTGLYLRI